MSNEADPDLKLLPQGSSTCKVKLSFSSLMPWLNLGMALFAVAGCVGLVLAMHAYKKEQIQIEQVLATTQQAFSNYKAQNAQVPDNIEVVLQELTDQIKGQKTSTKDLESLVVSELKPQINFLLKEFERAQEQPTQLPIDLVKLDIKATDLLAHVLGLADLYLSVFQDVAKVNTLLLLAEQLLANNNEAAYLSLKVVIAKDKQALAAVKMPDQNLLWSSLDTLLANVPQYAYKQLNQNEEPENTKVATAAANTANMALANTVAVNNTWWRSGLTAVWHKLSSLVKVKHNTGKVETLVTGAELTESLQRERLRMSLEQARWASANRDSKTYIISLSTAKNILLEYFSANNDLNKKAITELDVLAAINIQPDLPAHINSLQELDAILKTKMEAVQQ